MDTSSRRQRQQMRYSRQVDDRASYTGSSSDRRQGPLPPIPHHHPRQQIPRVNKTPNRPSSPSSMSSAPYTDDEAPMVRHHPPSSSRRSRSRSGSRLSDHHMQHSVISAGHPALMPMAAASHSMAYGPMYGGNDTLRSSRSVPVLNMVTWDGEPCPVHGHSTTPAPPVHMMPPMPVPQATMPRRSGSMFDLRSQSPFYPPPAPIAFYPPPQPPPPPMYAMPPPHLLPPMMRPRQLVIPAGTEPIQPLPVREPRKQPGRPPSSLHMLPRKGDEEYGGDYEEVEKSLCKGHLIVLWIILGVVTLGVLLGIILGVIIR